MRAVIQRVVEASVVVSGKEVAKIGPGFLVYLGITHSDTEKDAVKLASKISHLRIFSDEFDKMNQSLKDIAGEILIVSQFTLYGDITKGNRPSFVNAADPSKALPLYELLVKNLQASHVVKTGVFGENMLVKSTNNGPVTIIHEVF